MDLTSKIDNRLLATSGGRRTQAARQRKSLANYNRIRETLAKPGNVAFASHYKEDTIILDIGGRYSKVGFVGEPTPRRICRTNLYLGDERKSKPYFQQKFKAGVKLRPVVLSLSKVPQSPQTWQEMSELLVDDLLFNQLEIKPDKRRIIVLQDAWWPAPFQNALSKSFFRHGCPGVQFIDSLHSAVFTTGSDTAIIIDVGYHCTKISATMFGHIIPESVDWYPLGFYSIMSEFKILMRESTKLDFDKFRVEDEQIEKAIARTCFVQPKHISNNDGKENESFHPKSVSYEFNVRKQSAFCKIASSIRRKSCQVLFDEKRNIVHFLCDTLLKIPIDCRAKLVNNILLTGGTCSLPGFESRFVEEWKDAMNLPQYHQLKNLGHRFRLLKNEFPFNTRMFVGASIYANITQRFSDELFITEAQFKTLKNERIDDWTEVSHLKNLEYIQTMRKSNATTLNGIDPTNLDVSVLNSRKDFKNAALLKYLTHVDIVRKPQHRKGKTHFTSKLTGASPYRKTVIGGSSGLGGKRVSFGASGTQRGTLAPSMLSSGSNVGGSNNLSNDGGTLTKSKSFGVERSQKLSVESNVVDADSEDELDILHSHSIRKGDTNRMMIRSDTDDRNNNNASNASSPSNTNANDTPTTNNANNTEDKPQ